MRLICVWKCLVSRRVPLLYLPFSHDLWVFGTPHWRMTIEEGGEGIIVGVVVVQ